MAREKIFRLIERTRVHVENEDILSEWLGESGIVAARECLPRRGLKLLRGQWMLIGVEQ